MPTVYVTRKIPDVGLQLLKKKHFRVDLNHSDQNLSEEDLMPRSENGKLVADDIIDNLELKAQGENTSFSQLLDDDGGFIKLSQLNVKVYANSFYV